MWCQGVSALSLDECQGALALSLAMSALLWRCALLVGVVVGSLDVPMQTDEPLTVRGDAPRGLFTPRWAELQQTYGIERPQTQVASSSWDSPYAVMGEGGGHAGPLPLMNLLMTSLVGLMT